MLFCWGSVMEIKKVCASCSYIGYNSVRMVDSSASLCCCAKNGCQIELDEVLDKTCVDWDGTLYCEVLKRVIENNLKEIEDERLVK